MVRHLEAHAAFFHNSKLGRHLVRLLSATGFKFITNIDVSSTVISQMKDKYDPEKYPGLDCA